MIKATIYTRISNEEKARSESNSMGSQKEICEHYIQIQREKGWKFASLYEDPGFSGKDMNRPGIQKLLDDIRARKVDVVVAYKIDRISRSLRDFYQFWEVLKAHDVAFVSATQSFDTSNSTGMLMLNMLLSFAQFERELAVERTAARMANRAEKGFWNGGWYPFGYDYNKESKALTINKEESRVVAKIYELIASGYRPAEVKNKLNELGYRTKPRLIVRRDGKAREVGAQRFDEDHVTNIIHNPVYKGFVKHKEKVFLGQHKGIIPEKLWKKANTVLDSRSIKIIVHKDDHVHLLKGLIKCGDCGLSMTPTPAGKRDKDGNPYLYYSCIANHPDGKDSKCSIRAIPARPIEQALKRVLSNLGQNKQLLESVMEEATKEGKRSIQPLEKEKRALEEAISTLSGQIKRLVGIFTQKDLVSKEIKDEYKGLLAEREKKQTSLEKLEIDIARLKSKTVDLEIVHKALKQFDKVVESLPLSDQKEVFQLLIKELRIYPFNPEKESKLERGWFATKIKTNWYKVNLSLYEIPPEELNLAGESSEKKEFGSGTRIRT